MADKLTKTARNLRKKQTDAEKLLWKHLRARQLEGLKFRRQHTIGRYVVDFVCLEKTLVIELDGGQHAVKRKKDNDRDEWLRGEGFRVMRFWNNDVLTNIEGVLEVIRQNVSITLPQPLPSREGRF